MVVALSGGVDSSVAAALLKNQGYEVIGVYILGWTGTEEFPCVWQSEEADARSVAEQLGIPFYTVNLAEEYYREVVGRFLAGYRQGLTPNPDVLCNREIKFRALWQAVRQFEPDFLATGHYARLRRELPISDSKFLLKIGNCKLENSHHEICNARDESKDQTYFLWAIEREILPRLLFPIGDYLKSEVRALAKRFKLPNAAKKDSQGICFIGPLKVREFLTSQLKPEPGRAVLADGKLVGEHRGALLYTIGQRLGVGNLLISGDPPPLYVLAKDVKTNTLIVGHDWETFAESLMAENPNWLVEPKADRFVCQAKIRYRQEDVKVTVRIDGEGLAVKFTKPVRAITPGQSVVFYRGETLLGGAVVKEVPEQEKMIARTTEKFVSGYDSLAPARPRVSCSRSLPRTLVHLYPTKSLWLIMLGYGARCGDRARSRSATPPKQTSPLRKQSESMAS